MRRLLASAVLASILVAGPALADYTAVILNPSKFIYSDATGISGGQQVGFGASFVTTGGQGHALLWSGTAASYLDLHQYLPAGYISSQAFGIDGDGNIVGLANTINEDAYAVLWRNDPVAVPVPGALALGSLGIGFASWLCRRRAL
jgi:hypothetical protein